MTARIRNLSIAVLVVAGISSMGEGTRIYLKAILAQTLLQNAWNQTRSGGTNVKPWPWAEMHPVARLQVPTYDEDIIVLAGTTGKSLAFGPGHVLSSAAPGTDDNVAIAAHRDTHFAFLEHITPGEFVFLETPDGVRHRYQVSQIDILHQSKTEVMAKNGVKQLTLITCYPFHAITPGGPMRYVVRALEYPRDGSSMRPTNKVSRAS
jgi:sortase A|tara:strand:+ start:165 stop:785 length:621 start_codon:yes stop_codon:yes gene_type:complete